MAALAKSSQGCSQSEKLRPVWLGLGCLLCVLLPACLAVTAGPARSARSPEAPSLGEIIHSSDWIATGTVRSADPAGYVALMLRPLCGRLSSPETGVATRTEPGMLFLKRVRAGQPIILFGMNRRGLTPLGYTNGTWFRIQPYGKQWTLVSVHPELARSWNGPTPRLVEIVRKVRAGKAVAPPPDSHIRPSLGPVLPQR
ncbi:MAG: hypothetical protein C4321_10980 [Chloroflexota bacterium]